MLVVFAGLPGSGKTTLARRLSKSLQAVYVRIDSIENAIRRANRPAYEVGDLGYRVGYAMARDNLRACLTVVAASVNPVQESRDAWLA
ncbi:MAG: AAA family ATPase, partial [Burkholderiaceae bacterium]|nr:AAA family ATPase [Burkholderiaceae bacterium]